MFGKLKSLMKSGKEPDLVPEIESVTIGRTVLIDQLVLDLLGESTHLELASATLPITAQGLVNLSTDGETTYVHRFYTDDDVMFQVMTDALDGGNVQEISVFTPFDSAYPNTKARWKEWEDLIKAERFETDDGSVFERVWFEGEPGPAELVRFWETIYDDREKTGSRRIFQSCMLFARELESETVSDEFLLAIIMEPENGDKTVELMVGIPLASTDFNV